MNHFLVRRKVMSNKYLKALRSDTLATLASMGVDQLPLVDVIVCSKRPMCIGNITSYLNKQTAKIGKVIFIVSGYDAGQVDLLKLSVTNGEVIVIEEAITVSLKDKINMAVSKSTSDYIAIMDDDNIYYPNYLHGQLAKLIGIDPNGMVTINNAVAMCNKTKRVGLYYANLVSCDKCHGTNGSVVINKTLLELYPIESFGLHGLGKYISNLKNEGHTVVYANPFNFVYVRGTDNSREVPITRTRLGYNANDISLTNVIL